MYKVLDVQQFMFTRNIILSNLETGKVIKCFDMDLKDDFKFIKVNEIYDCKILLFGNYVKWLTERTAKYKIIEENYMIGKRQFFKVSIKDSIYYLIKKKGEIYENIDNGFIYFDCSRYDLIQVNDVVLHDFR